MDIVDIDKVLDDFELSEDRNLRASNQCRTEQIIVATTEDNKCASIKNVTDGVQSEVSHSRVHHQSISSPNSKNIKSNFVNVSNVFMSLNEYVNAGLDKTTGAEPFQSVKSHVTHSNQETSSSTIPISTNSLATTNQQELPANVLKNSLTNTGDTQFQINSEIKDQYDNISQNSFESDEEDQSITSPTSVDSTTTTATTATTTSNSSYEDGIINKCTEEAILLTHDKDGDTYESDDQMQSPIQVDKEHDDNYIVPEDKADKNDTPQKQMIEESNTLYSLSRESETSKALSENQNTELKMNAAHSLGESSSITVNTTIDSSHTPTTSSPIPPTFSNNDLSINQPSSTVTTLPVLSYTSNDDESLCHGVSHVIDSTESQVYSNFESNIDEKIVDDCISNISLIEPDNKCSIQVDKVENSEDIINDKVPEPDDSNRFIKPLCFEAAATMDDVSDTELESYLQELEDLESSPAHNSSFIPFTNAPKGKNISPSQSNPQFNYLDMVDSEPSIDFEVDRINAGLKDDKNADSFSQASTIEFADIGPESDFETTTNKNNNLTDWKTPKKETILNKDTDDLRPLESPNIENVPITNELENGQMANLSEVCEIQTVQRPKTLELPPSYNEAVMNTAAGSTPAVISSGSLNPDNSNSRSTLQPAADTDISEKSQLSVPSAPLSPDASVPIPTIVEIDTQTPASEADIRANTTATATGCNLSVNELGKVQPYWIPDNETTFCMQCNMKFSFIKRRHHCRACGQVLCSACCSLKAKLEYMGDIEARICIQCDILLNSLSNIYHGENDQDGTATGIDVASDIESNQDTSSPNMLRSPNPNNPMEYCSTIPPLQQVGASSASAQISVMVPVGVLKRDGVSLKPPRKDKNVMFSDGIRPGCDLTDLDNNWGESSGSDGSSNNYRKSGNRRVQTPPATGSSLDQQLPKKQQKKPNISKIKYPVLDEKTNSFIPAASTVQKDTSIDTTLPPICISVSRTECKFTDVSNNVQLIERLKNEQLKFIIQRNFYVLVKVIKLTCCINKTVINFTTHGMHHIGQDEIVILLELDDSSLLPKDIFLHLNEIFRDADRGHTITELGFSIANSSTFLGSKEHGGFLYIRTTFQCLQNVHVPDNPYLIGILIHRWEIPWAKIFPLRLMLRLGALYRYYPSPHVSVRNRNSVYAEIAQTIINFLADFRTYSYTLATIQGMFIHMEDRKTNVLIPRNRYDQIMKALNNSSEHILALAGNFSKLADGHLVCVQNTESGCAETHAYSTQAINIQGKPRKVTGASFIVLNGALKSTSGLSGKCSIVEDGLMVQILPKKMAAIQQALKTMKNVDIVCGPIDADISQTELVSIQWVENDTEFNVGVVSCIDRKPMDGIPSIRVHRGLELFNSNHIVRWTEVFIIKSDEESAHGKDPIDMSKLAEHVARSACIALVTFLDLLAANGLVKLALRATLDPDQVCYEAGSNYEKLAPLYMNALDNELVPTLHRQASNLQLEQSITIELVFHILEE